MMIVAISCDRVWPDRRLKREAVWRKTPKARDHDGSGNDNKARKVGAECRVQVGSWQGNRTGKIRMARGRGDAEKRGECRDLIDLDNSPVGLLVHPHASPHLSSVCQSVHVFVHGAGATAGGLEAEMLPDNHPSFSCSYDAIALQNPKSPQKRTGRLDGP